MSGLAIGVDLDGVVYPFDWAFRRYLVNRGIRHPSQCPDPVRWEFYRDCGMTTPEFLEHFANGINAGTIFGTGEPYHGAVRAIQRIKDAGHQIHVITDRTLGKPGEAARLSIDWMNRVRMSFDHVHFTAHKTRVAVDFMIDDKVENYDAMESVIPGRVFLMDRPWNQGHPARRVSSLDEYVDAIEAHVQGDAA